ncbi:MAG TPA: four helix bundle protein [Opitutaceae bacterium]|nr:four helix bundle protein [Opitutaceae bacterium]
MTSDESTEVRKSQSGRISRPGRLAEGHRSRQADLHDHQSIPFGGKIGLISQMRRAAVSISSNIAEGQARHTTGEFILFLSHAEGSVAELDTQLHLAVELGFTSEHQSTGCLELLGDLRRMLNGLRRKLASSS